MKASYAAWGSVVLAGALATAACSTSPSEGGGGEGAHIGHSNSAGQGAGAPEGSTGANPSTGTSIATGPLTTSGTGPSATTGTSTGTGECSGGDPQTCANCCDAAHSEGATSYQTTLENCACAGACASACAVVCQNGGAPDQGCLACLQADLNNGACSQDPCASDPDCLALQDCENACDASGTTTTTGSTGATTTTTTTTGPSTSAVASTTAGGGTSYEVARVDCVDDINMYRATLNLPPYARWGSNEACTDGQAQNDGTVNMAHDAFGQCGEHAQDECPGWPGPPEQMIGQCLAQMWAEGPGTDFNTHGHYINMSSTQYTMVSCGYHVFSDGSVWATQDFQ